MYKILLNGEQVGCVQVEKEGLYYRFNCTCALKDDEIYRIYVKSGNSRIKLGVCVPDGNSLILSTKVPVKHLQGDDFHFSLEADCEKVYSIFNGQPFMFLDQLQTAHLQIADGQLKIIID